MKQKCSGILVASNYVLTSCHCIGKYDTNTTLVFYDSVWAYPAFDNGLENLLFGRSLGVEYITFKSNLKFFLQKDIALIKLKDDIGTKTGWIGIAFSNDISFFMLNVFHKLSYPAAVDPSDSTRVFNGDTLYYNYGILDLIQDEWLGYDIYGIPGQSGSSLFFTDNEEYYSFGTLDWSTNSRHIRINPEIFYAFKPVINNGTANIEINERPGTGYYLSEAYPNPFNPTTKIKYTIPHNAPVQLKIYDIIGREIRSLVNEVQDKGKYEVTFNATGLTSGMYFCRIQSSDFVSTKKLGNYTET